MKPRIVLITLAMVALTVISAYAYLQDQPDGLGARIHRIGHTPLLVVREVVAAWGFIAAGLLGWHRRPDSRVGALMVAVGGALLLRGFQYLETSPATSVAIWLGAGAGLTGVLLGLLILTYPTGRLTSRGARAWVGLGAGYLTIQLIAMTLTWTQRGNCDCRSAFILKYDQVLQINVVNFADLWFAGMAIFLMVVLGRKWTTLSAPARRSLTPLWISGAVIMFVAVTGESFWTRAWETGYFRTVMPSIGNLVWGGRHPTVWAVLPWVQSVSFLLVPIALMWGLLRIRLRQSAVASLAVDLGRTGGFASLIQAMRKALADPSLDVVFWSRPVAAYVSPNGERVNLPVDGGARSVTTLRGEEGPLAALIHDPALDDQRPLVDGVAAVARLAIENERLHAEVRAQLEEVRASRERIVRAGDDERRRVERNLHDGAQQRLVSLAIALTMAQTQMKAASPHAAATLAQAESELRLAIGELRELARGIHPAILGEAGLTSALEALGERSPIPVRVASNVTSRLSPLVEATAYFVAAEALTNVAKYASATSVELSVVETDGWLHLVVRDDGVGGADPEAGSGLRGLIDRVAAVGGRLSIESLTGRGTLVAADLPCA